MQETLHSFIKVLTYFCIFLTGFIIPVICAAMAVIGLVIILLLIACHRRRRRKRRTSAMHRAHLEEKLNTLQEQQKTTNQNQENFRRYHNPLRKDNVVPSSDSSEAIELDLDDKSVIPSNLYKASSPDVCKNTLVNKIDMKKDLNLHLSQQQRTRLSPDRLHEVIV